MIRLVQEWFSESARRFPDKVAVVCDAESIRYAELDAATNALAQILRARELARGAFVPLFLGKGINAVKAILAVLKADGAYVPLDTSSPAPRIQRVLEAARAPLVLVDASSIGRFQALFPAGGAPPTLNVDEAPLAPAEALESRNLSIDVAYVLFTSGSTGIPKGVMISHQMIIDYIDWCVETYRITDRDVIANHAPLYFDNSTFDLYTAFRSGASLHLVHDALNTIMAKLVPWLREREITIFFCVPSVMAILLRTGRIVPGEFPRLRHLIAAGEVLPPDTLRRWMELCPHVQFTNMYGPTEITVDCTFHVVREAPAPGTRSIPIGRARCNMEVFVRLEDGTLAASPGSEGEIVVRGSSVSYGYLNDPARTRASFIQNPRHDLYHDPLYRTGDLGRIAPDGSLLFLGRVDQQIKYMGNRIELGEIEAAIFDVDGIADGVVVFHEGAGTEQQCIGALVCLSEGIGKLDVAAALRERLPGYMVPRRIAVVEELPRLPNGKVDRSAALEQLFGRSDQPKKV